MKKNPKLAIAVMIITAVVGIVHYTPSSEVRFFCSNDRVFIEFEEYGKVWGTMWLDDAGAPVSCSSAKVKSNSKNSII
jgi:hypothetical protein